MGPFSYMRISALYNRAKNVNAVWSLFDRTRQIINAAIMFVAAVIAGASTTWHSYWDTYSWAGVAFAFLVSCIGLSLAFFLSGLGVSLWRRGQPLLATSPSIAPPLPETAAPSELPVPLHMAIRHVRSSAYFDKLEEKRMIILVLEFLNASAEEITLESVNGYLSYVGVNGVNEKALHPVTWLDERQPPRAKPFDDIPINFQQTSPPESIQLLLEQARNGKPFSIKFHLQTKAKVLATAEVIELRPWEGVSCQTKSLPVVTGRIISLGMGSR